MKDSVHKTILIMAGGTGGHVSPGLAVAHYLREQMQAQVIWLGASTGIETELVPAAGIPFYTISISGLRRSGWRRLLLAPWQVSVAVWQAVRLIRQLKPTVVLGFGGFASGPGGLAAWLCRVPLIVHEQNAVIGMTNKILSHFATRCLQAFPDAFPAKYAAEVTGNPVKHSIEALPAPEQRFAARDKAVLHLLVVGGSLGAKRLNEIVPAAIMQLAPELSLEVLHQTGKAEVTAVTERYAGVACAVRVTPFIADMAEAYAWADLVISRAGALTVSELAAAGVGSILIPFPHAVDDHQTKNAHYLVANGAAHLMSDAALSVAALVQQLKQYDADRTTLLRMAQAARGLRRQHAAQRVATCCQEIIIE